MNINLTLFIQSFIFLLFAWFCMKFVWPPILANIENRQKKIADGQAAANKSLAVEAETQEKVQQELDAAKGQTADIVQGAQRKANETIEAAKSKAKVEGDAIISKAQTEIDAEVSSARSALSGQITDLAKAGVAKVLSKGG